EIVVLKEAKDPLILQSLQEDPTTDHESALLRIYQRLRPGNPPQLEKAKELFHEKFFDTNRYRLGKVGRFRINRKFNQDIPDDQMTLDPLDYVNAIRYILNLRKGRGHVDDIDHLGNRRLRTIDELAADELRKGFLKLRRTVQERMSLKDAEDLAPRSLINPKSISAAIEYFFGRGELSQVVDQTNPLAQLTHERRLSALGPGGLNRKRAGFEVRDVHISHYGRICPIETPEGTNIGLISSLGIYAGVDEYGFLVTPYREIKHGHPTDKVKWMRADEDAEAYLAPADAPSDDHRKLKGPTVIARYQTDFHTVGTDQVQYMDISPKQMVGVSAGLIPFLEHDDANRALMGSNMQRQAVPLLVAEPPIVATGLERPVAMNSGMIVRATHDGKITYVDSNKIVLDEDPPIKLRKYVGLNERTCLNQKPVITLGQKVKKGDILADGASTYKGELALGRNVLVGFMAWDGYNFEDAIIISERLVKEDVYTSIHIEEFEIEIRETKLGREEFTRDIPNVSEKALRNLDENGIIRIGTYCKPGDILVGKVAPKSKSELTPEEKLLHAIFGRAGEDVKNDSLEVPSGVEGIVINTQRFSRRMSLNEDERKAFEKELKDTETVENAKIAEEYKAMIKALEEAIGGPVLDPGTGKPLGRDKDAKVLADESERFKLEALDLRSPDKTEAARKVVRTFGPRVEALRDEKDRKLNSLKRGDELPSGVLQMVKVYIATKRVISVGDKMAGRHGNKVVIAKILPEEDMPFLADGTAVEILLNPLGVPSRMNVGQILETHLGWAAANTEVPFQAICPVFDGASEDTIRGCLVTAGLPENGKAQ
ncbi:MAG TPA: DNA-directed RNA polymerase subunit beta, partial [Isosphaeraceae bacterium]